ncbi:MAG TPA: DUF4339 domain-containing protein [Verrucomicrobiae bacterium]|jgi:hypothetical protein|nr:DUF4339 domain-containing protein [Verrucomicrobiae bacterium]
MFVIFTVLCYTDRVKWFYAVDGQVKGPVERAELEVLFKNGEITTSTLVIQEGMYGWVPFVDLKKTTQFLNVIGDPSKTQPQ